MESPDKQVDLVKIFLAVTDILSKEGFEHQSKLAQLTSLVETGQLDEQLKNIVKGGRRIFSFFGRRRSFSKCFKMNGVGNPDCVYAKESCQAAYA